jgi:hypothetical protein
MTRLSCHELLVAPIVTNRLPWSKGYFETIDSRLLDSTDVLPVNCFLSTSRGLYFDEGGNRLPGPVEPVGDYALDSYKTIDDSVSDALGFPRAPDPE